MNDETAPLGWSSLSGIGPSSGRILVVEDHEEALEGLRRLVEAMGHHAEVARSAEEADRWVSQEAFDLILLDVHLPRMNGVEFLNWSLRRAPTTAVIMVTGHDDADVALECMRQGARTYLVKPIDPEILKVSVQDALAVRQLLLAYAPGAG